MKYLSTAEAAAKWNLSQRRVAVLCEQQRIPDAQKAGSTWIIPEDAEKPQTPEKRAEGIGRKPVQMGKTGI